MGRKRPPAPDPFAARLAAERVELAEHEAAAAAARAEHAGDLAWVTRDRDTLLAAIDYAAESLVRAFGWYNSDRDPEEVAQNVARWRRIMLDGGAELLRRREEEPGRG